MHERFEYRIATTAAGAFDEAAQHTVRNTIDHFFSWNAESFNNVFRIICEQCHFNALPDQLACEIEGVETALNYDGKSQWWSDRFAADHRAIKAGARL